MFSIVVNPGTVPADIDRIVNGLKTGVKPALEEGGKAGVSHAQSVVPVRTGFLRSTIYSQITSNELEIGARADYAAAVEFGHRRYPIPRPFIRPGAEVALKAIQTALPKGLGLS
jgi:hypothetical protein